MIDINGFSRTCFHKPLYFSGTENLSVRVTQETIFLSSFRDILVKLLFNNFPQPHNTESIDSHYPNILCQKY